MGGVCNSETVNIAVGLNICVVGVGLLPRYSDVTGCVTDSIGVGVTPFVLALVVTPQALPVLTELVTPWAITVLTYLF